MKYRKEKTMKNKLLILVTVVALVFALGACTNKDTKSESSPDEGYYFKAAKQCETSFTPGNNVGEEEWARIINTLETWGKSAKLSKVEKAQNDRMIELQKQTQAMYMGTDAEKDAAVAWFQEHVVEIQAEMSEDADYMQYLYDHPIDINMGTPLK